MSRALIAMSGGVDSSVAAFLMKQAGYDCIGATMRLFGNEAAGVPPDDTEDAKNIADRLFIPHHTFDLSDSFKTEVISRFADSYERGLTPNPCIDCNKYLKFGEMLRRADELGCDVIVTGHYARIACINDRYLLKKAAHTEKDQSYVLYTLTQEQLKRVRFPLGELTKDEVRNIAEEQGFLNAKKKESQDICFAPDGDYAAAIERFTGKTYPAGNFVGRDGRIFGTHKGLIRYTVGQRKGLGLALPEPLYVCEKRVADNTVVLGKNEELYTRTFFVKNINWILFDAPPETLRVKVKIRYRQIEQSATVTAKDGGALVTFDEPQRAVTAGQAAVFYDGKSVVGGGVIVEGW